MVAGRTVAEMPAYAAAMAVTLVYTGEHYVVDVSAGMGQRRFSGALGAVVRRRGVG
jgi:hypothetical protein